MIKAKRSNDNENLLNHKKENKEEKAETVLKKHKSVNILYPRDRSNSRKTTIEMVS